MKIDPLFDGWWTVRSPKWPEGRCKHHCQQSEVVQVHAGDEWDIDRDRGPWPTREIAESFQYQDDLPSYWAHNLDVYADHCLNCGRFAPVLAFDHKGWRVTDCDRCGVIDSRDHSCFS